MATHLTFEKLFGGCATFDLNMVSKSAAVVVNEEDLHESLFLLL
jgi:hypothetical protein